MLANVINITEIMEENCIDNDNIIPIEHISNENNVNVPLKKDGTPKKTTGHKQKGKSSEVYAFEMEDAKSILEYFEYKESWLHYLIFVLSCNMARRIVDTLALTWENLFDPLTGEFRSQIEIVEQKTSKNAKVHINSACREAIKLYLQKTGIDPSENGYKNFVCVQTKGAYKGRVLTDEGYRQALKTAAKNCGVNYNVGTHSGRKMAGKILLETHPEDVRNMSIIQSILNHADSKTTERYIGRTKKMEDDYLDDLGNDYLKYVMGNETYNPNGNSPIVHFDINEIRDIIKAAYIAGLDNANNTNPNTHIDAINQIMEMIDKMKK